MSSVVSRTVYPAESHHIRETLLDRDALFVIQTLQDAGYTAYLVGGGVRDLLLGKQPKDYDISTSAHPEEIKKVFRNCLLIGRRFRLAHVRFGPKIFEVSTFRAGEQGSELVVRDNEYGTPEQDAFRRDFTINGLFYDPSTHEIIDYVGGYEDLQAHRLRSIGPALKRFKQDPVRMIRCLKFRARFDFEIDDELKQALEKGRREILKSSPPRMLEEVLRMLESGASERFFRLLHEYNFLDLLFPAIGIDIESEMGEEIFALMRAADKDKAPDRNVLVAAMLYPLLALELKEDFADAGLVPNLQQVADRVEDLVHDCLFESFAKFTRQMRATVAFILEMQYRMQPLEPLKTRRVRLARHVDFPHAIGLLELRSRLDESLQPTLDEWKELLPEKPVSRPPARRRRRRR
jgi:poly(A) polymerase